MSRIRTIDAHAGGAPTRLIVEGFPPLRGDSLEEKRAWADEHADAIRLALLREPRGHADMAAAVFTEAAEPGAVAGLLFLNHDGFTPLSGSGLIAAVTIALERGLLVLREQGPFRLETLAGLVEVQPSTGSPGADDAATLRVDEVTYRPPPVFVSQASMPVLVDNRRTRVDVAWASGWFVIVDREALGVPPEAGSVEPLRRAARKLVDLLGNRTREWRGPDGVRGRLEGVILTGPPGRDDADLRSLTVYADGTVDRSPSGTGTAAVLAVLDAMGLAAGERPLHHEGPSGAVFRARVAHRVSIGETPAIVPEITGSAWITGEHTFLLDTRDPFATGFSW